MMTSSSILHRRALHRQPELSGQEQLTSRYIQTYMQKSCPSATVERIANTGLLIHFVGQMSAPSILLRCELDALPIQESNTFDHASAQQGISHKCGHDGHMSILLDLAIHLEQHPPKGKVSLLFQPSEENGKGAISVVRDPVFLAEQSPDYVFALHNIPGAPLNQILCKTDAFTPAVISVEIELIGKTSHASEPENGVNPIYCLSRMMPQILAIPKADEHEIITPIFCDLGSRDFGISAGEGKIGLTLRAPSNKQLTLMRQNLEELVKRHCDNHKLRFSIEWQESFSSIVNHPEAVGTIQEAAKSLQLEYVNKNESFPWGEDFGVFTEHFKGAMFGLGAGTNCPALHTPEYDFPDELIETGSTMFERIISLIQK